MKGITGNRAKQISYRELIHSVLKYVRKFDFDQANKILYTFSDQISIENAEAENLIVLLAEFIIRKYQGKSDECGEILYRIKQRIKKVEITPENQDDINFVQLRFYNFYSVYLSEKQEYDLAIVFNKKAIGLSRKMGDNRFECSTLINLGFLYHAEKQYNKSLQVFKNALEISDDLEEFKGKNNIYNGLSISYFELNEYINAYFYAEKAIVAAVKEGNTALIPHYLCGQAECCLSDDTLSDKVEEIIFRLESIVLKGKEKHSDLVFQNIKLVKALNYLHLNQYQKVIDLLSPLIIENEIKDHSLKLKAYDYLTQAYMFLNLNAKAKEFFEAYKALKEEAYQNARSIYFQRQSEYLSILYSEMDQGKEMLEKEVELRLSAEKDTKEIINLTRKTAAQKRELEELNKSLEHFSRMVAHDLKEPLRTMKSFSQLLMLNEKENIKEASLEYLNYIFQGGQRMESMIDSILEYTRLGFNEVEHKVVNLDNTLHQTIYDLSAQINQANAKIIIETTLPEVFGVKETLKLLFQNLISNALKFIKENQLPEITIGHKRVKNEIIFFVKDNGIGIEEQNIEKVFQTFIRLNAKSKYEGSGLGLATCYKIIKQHKGKIWIESEVGQGTTFFFTINPELTN